MSGKIGPKLAVDFDFSALKGTRQLVTSIQGDGLI